ncbi:hypothetical protein XENORESO_011270 [Xenotaenia resolanae]|uniref:Uncharacterized protein n=1 Tax=Xenotaenia resolanae TaxID=208358 RepID=A0ABV0VQA5_9TELE
MLRDWGNYSAPCCQDTAVVWTHPHSLDPGNQLLESGWSPSNSAQEEMLQAAVGRTPQCWCSPQRLKGSSVCAFKLQEYVPSRDSVLIRDMLTLHLGNAGVTGKSFIGRRKGLPVIC